MIEKRQKWKEKNFPATSKFSELFTSRWNLLKISLLKRKKLCPPAVQMQWARHIPFGMSIGKVLFRPLTISGWGGEEEWNESESAAFVGGVCWPFWRLRDWGSGCVTKISLSKDSSRMATSFLERASNYSLVVIVKSWRTLQNLPHSRRRRWVKSRRRFPSPKRNREEN